jgi:hypothetical protein
VIGVRIAQQRVWKGGVDAINQRPSDQSGATGSSLPREDTGQLSPGASGRGEQVEGATAGDDPWVGSLVPRGECAH